MAAMNDATEGSPADRNVFLLLLLAGLFILKKRNVNWNTLISNNRWLFYFYLFFGLSVVWSDEPFVSCKRWIKDLGNVVMVLVILTERNRIDALRTVFARCAYLLIPLSVLFVKYYPDLGRAYDPWNGRPFYQGVTLGKNMLGGTVFTLMLFLVWELIQNLRSESKAAQKTEIISRLMLLAMAVWLLSIADSATSIACTILGSVGLVALSLPFIKKRLKNLVAYSVAGVVLLMILTTLVDLGSGAAGMLGRNSSLTGRTEIWQAVLAEKTNPVIGTGFSSFWLGSRADRLSEKYFFRLNQAHNGYLEIYLDGGAIGICLLIGMLVSAGRNISKQLLIDPDWASVRLMFWLIIMVHNWTEASFCRLSPLWFVLLVVILQYPGRSEPEHSAGTTSCGVSTDLKPNRIG